MSEMCIWSCTVSCLNLQRFGKQEQILGDKAEKEAARKKYATYKPLPFNVYAKKIYIYAAVSCCSCPPCPACLWTSCHMCKALLVCSTWQFTSSTVSLKVISSNYSSLSPISRASFATERLTDLLWINGLGRLSYPMRFVTALCGDPARPVLRPRRSDTRYSS